MIATCGLFDIIIVAPVASDGFFNVGYGELWPPFEFVFTSRNCNVLSLRLAKAIFYHIPVRIIIFSISAFADSPVFEYFGWNFSCGHHRFCFATLFSLSISQIWIVRFGFVQNNLWLIFRLFSNKRNWLFRLTIWLRIWLFFGLSLWLRTWLVRSHWIL